MGWPRSRRRRNNGIRAVVAERLDDATPSEATSTAPPGAPTDVRPPRVIPPGESRYRRIGGLRERLDAIDEPEDDLHVTIDLTELRHRTVR